VPRIALRRRRGLQRLEWERRELHQWRGRFTARRGSGGDTGNEHHTQRLTVFPVNAARIPEDTPNGPTWQSDSHLQLVHRLAS
jgi:hypothetical protein